MTSKYYYVNFPNLRIREFDTSPFSNCAVCRFNNNKICSDCIYLTGTGNGQDKFNPMGTVLVMRGQNVKRANYYDEIISSLVEEKQNVMDDIKNYRQW
jgi:hypothetical protein